MRQFYRAFPMGSALGPELGGPDDGAAALLGALPTTMQSKIKRLGLR
jgi:hypothetical protein